MLISGRHISGHPELNFKDTFVYTDRGWNLLARKWTRPAIIKTRMKNKDLEEDDEEVEKK
ncbi:MAG: hypothetical protein ACYS30_24960 [Planctomycetota bacterium]|jgi:hypothetical protein